MSRFTEYILGIATGRYGPGKPARALAPMAVNLDPAEIMEEAQCPMTFSTSTMGWNPQLSVMQKNAPDTTLPPEAQQGPEQVGEAMLATVVEPLRQVHIPSKAPTPVSATPARETRLITEEHPRTNLEKNSATPSPFPSYAEAQAPIFILPDMGEMAPNRPETTDPVSAAFQGPARPGLIPSGQPVKEPPAPAAPLLHEPAAAASVPGLEIGELTISVTPAPEPAPVRSVPTSRGSGISASAAIRRAGIRRL